MTNVIELKSKTPQAKQGAVESVSQDTGTLVVQALGFYADQGWDGGLKARTALIAMQAEINKQAELEKQ